MLYEMRDEEIEPEVDDVTISFKSGKIVSFKERLHAKCPEGKLFVFGVTENESHVSLSFAGTISPRLAIYISQYFVALSKDLSIKVDPTSR